MFKWVQRCQPVWLAAAFLVVGNGAMAQPSSPSAVVVNGPAGPLTAGELDFVVRERIPADKRAEFWSSPEQVTRLATGVYAQRVMAAEAAKEKLDQSPQGQTYLKLSRDRAMAELLMQERVKAAVPSEEAQKAFAQSEYKAKPERFTTPEEVHVRHILLPVAKDGSDAAAVKAKAEALLAELRKGANFEELAKTRSGDPGSASKGGDLGVFTRGLMVPEFEKAAFAMTKPGQLSEPVKTQFGYHILQLVEHKPAQLMPFDKAFPLLREQMLNKLNGDERMRVWNAAQEKAKPDEAQIKALAEAETKKR